MAAFLFLFIGTAAVVHLLAGLNFFEAIIAHPLVMISMQGLFVESFLQDVNPVNIAIVMVTATLANDAAGTFNVPITMMSQYTKRNPYQLTWWNLPFALMFGGTGVALAYVLL
ncbi:hypothetical protein D7Z54_03600 [Salibacterium salarium]|uniref:Citrate transporter n=1 Tax=Salibacterium salarium TaxID=284579 RepID=A0A3R9PBR3_9BACI|nr:hypothetical protein [Salibacterium salarium]RSL34925.1 hypothetical protein D7Z54_03600 [Salibacterium salarium]